MKSRVYYNLDNGLDYFTIIIILSDNNIIPDQYTKYKIKKNQFERFANLIKKGVALLPDISILNTTNRIDIITIKLNTLLQIIIKNTKAWNIIKSRTTF